MVWLEKNSKINKREDVYFALKSKRYFYKLIFKCFVDSIFSANRYKNFDFKLNANKRGVNLQIHVTIKKYISRKVNYGRQRCPIWWDYRLFYSFWSVFGLIMCEAFLERGVVPCFQTGYEIETFPLTQDDD